MVAPRRKKFPASRRRTHDDEGEDDGTLGATAVEDDSSSQQSIPSDLDEDADAEGSDASELGTPNKNGFHGKEAQTVHTTALPPADAKNAPFSATVADTEVMMNGMKISQAEGTANELEFENTGEAGDQETPQEVGTNNKQETLAERRRREHEEYKRKRDADPAFVPNRGGFFMHDQRSASGQNGFRSMGRGRGRGRGGFAPFSPLGTPHNPASPADAPWSHDLHETVTESTRSPADVPKHGYQNMQSGKPPTQPQSAAPPNRSFSRTVQLGNIQLRVMIAGMTAPIVFSAMPFNQHTRLPQHRPPLRRDKPVRVSLPNNPPRYIFPAIDRSFIFIPRALRPNQQGFHRGRGRGSFGYPSGRTSVYGGSVYSPSVAMSRRSSFARDVGREAMASPAGSVMSRNRSIIMDPHRPVVRLPPPVDMAMMAGHMPPPFVAGLPMPAPIVNLPMINRGDLSSPQPQDPLSQESLPVSLPIHQPRPQKTVSVAGIESPENLAVQAPPPQQQQPFHHQVPMTFHGNAGSGQQFSVESPMGYSGGQHHPRRPSHPSQQGTPLSQIPDRAIHAQPFQPYPYAPQPQPYYPQQYPAGPVYYYPTAPPSMQPSMGGAPFVPGQQYPYMMPPPPPPPQAANPHGDSGTPGPNNGTVAHESNGMVYYYDSTQLAVPQTSDEHANAYQPMAYPPGSGYVMSQPAVYYPTQ